VLNANRPIHASFINDFIVKKFSGEKMFAETRKEKSRKAASNVVENNRRDYCRT
jgi:hypothetical protein